MGEVREKRGAMGLMACAREDAGAPRHVESAAEQLIKQLVHKQTDTHTTLHQQLSLRQNFVAASQSDSSFSLTSDDDNLSVEELKSKTGLSRQELESALSEKPNSAISKLYRFALSNQAGAVEKNDLISQLRDHPLNHLKALEEDFMKNIESKNTCTKKKSKHRKRRKKTLIEQSCEPSPHYSLPSKIEKGSCSNASVEGSCFRTEQDTTDAKSGDDKALSLLDDSVDKTGGTKRKRPSLWDVRDVTTMEKHLLGCEVPKLFTIKDGVIVQVTNKKDSS